MSQGQAQAKTPFTAPQQSNAQVAASGKDGDLSAHVTDKSAADLLGQIAVTLKNIETMLFLALK